MSANSGIAWTDNTFNPWWGCTKVSPGCDNCYAERMARRFYVRWGSGEPRMFFGAEHWRQPLRWNARAAREGRRIRVFCASMADVFDNEVSRSQEVSDGARARLWALIRDTPNLDWQILTKRIGNVPSMLPADWSARNYPHVWLGITVVTQEEAERDIPRLLAIPARVRWLSVEPQLESMYLRDLGLRCIDWVIVGGESGPKARPFNLNWARSLRSQCKAEGVAFFMKQLGSVAARVLAFKDSKGGDPSEWLEDLRVREFPA